MQPDTGGRFDLRLREQDDRCAGYALTLSTEGGEWSTELTVSAADGDVRCGTWRGEGDPPPWLFRYAHSALRSAWHAHREEGWPRRLTRWRAEPTAGSQRNDP
jgi:hypothetical protein